MAAETNPGRKPTAFVDTRGLGARALRGLELDAGLAQFTGGCNEAGSNSPGIGIDVDGGARLEDPTTWTLQDQGDALDNPMVAADREPQVGQYLGGGGYEIRDGDDADTFVSTGVPGKGTVAIQVFNREERPADPVEGNVAPNANIGGAEFPTLGIGWRSDGTPVT